MLPTAYARASSNASSTYFRRILKPQQMDLEYTFWLMLQLCVSPKTAYRQTSYHKQTKNQWARDDPAFVVVSCALLAAAGVAFCVTFSDSLWHAVATIVSGVLVDFLLVGAAVATGCWAAANGLLRRRSAHTHSVEQRVEWLYAFDVHCNSFLPVFLLLYVVQLLASPLLLWQSRLAAALSAGLYAAALGHYAYLTFLGYAALPFLERTEVFLWPIAALAVAAPLAALSGTERRHRAAAARRRHHPK